MLQGLCATEHEQPRQTSVCHDKFLTQFRAWFTGCVTQLSPLVMITIGLHASKCCCNFGMLAPLIRHCSRYDADLVVLHACIWSAKGLYTGSAGRSWSRTMQQTLLHWRYQGVSHCTKRCLQQAAVLLAVVVLPLLKGVGSAQRLTQR
jgi:hypothetical protein